MKLINDSFILLKGIECDAEKKRFKYLKTPIKGLFYIPSEIERKSRSILFNRFIPKLLDALQKMRNTKMNYGVATSAWNFGLTWRPVKFIEIFNSKKSFIIDFSRFAGRYGSLHSYYSKMLSKFYNSLSIKQIIFRKLKTLPIDLIYDDHYLGGFFIKKEAIPKYLKKYIPKNAKKLLFLKREYLSISEDMKKMR